MKSIMFYLGYIPMQRLVSLSVKASQDMDTYKHSDYDKHYRLYSSCLTIISQWAINGGFPYFFSYIPKRLIWKECTRIDSEYGYLELVNQLFDSEDNGKHAYEYVIRKLNALIA